MGCPYCQSAKISQLTRKTLLSYQQYCCTNCGKQFNERTGTKLNYIEYRTEVVMMVLHYYYRFKVSLDDVVELMAMRGIELSHQTVANWASVFGVILGMKLREQRQGKSSNKWHVDSTYLRINGSWCYFYRAIDNNGNLVDVYLSEERNQAAAESFFKQAVDTVGFIPAQITTDKEPALYPAIKNTFGNNTNHRDSKYMNNRIEQDHRCIKSRYRIMKGFKNFISALIFGTVFEEIRQLFRMNNKTRAERRSILMSKIQNYNELFLQVA